MWKNGKNEKYIILYSYIINIKQLLYTCFLQILNFDISFCRFENKTLSISSKWQVNFSEQLEHISIQFFYRVHIAGYLPTILH